MSEVAILRWSRQTDSNRRPADYKSAALPAELCRRWKRANLKQAMDRNKVRLWFGRGQALSEFLECFPSFHRSGRKQITCLKVGENGQSLLHGLRRLISVALFF